MVSNPLTAMGTFLVNSLQQRLKEVSKSRYATKQRVSVYVLCNTYVADVSHVWRLSLSGFQGSTHRQHSLWLVFNAPTCVSRPAGRRLAAN